MPITAEDLQRNRLFSLEGKTAVLTGASGFLGRTFALALLANGARVVALGRSDRLKKEGEIWAEEFGKEKVAVEQIDMYDTPALNTLCDRIAAEEPSIDILVNNAHELGAATGFNVPEGSLENSTFDQWQRNLQGGVYWAVQTTQRLGLRMKEQRRGSIINIATMYASVAPRPQLYEGTASLNTRATRPPKPHWLRSPATRPVSGAHPACAPTASRRALSRTPKTSAPARTPSRKTRPSSPGSRATPSLTASAAPSNSAARCSFSPPTPAPTSPGRT